MTMKNRCTQRKPRIPVASPYPSEAVVSKQPQVLATECMKTQ